ncbi:C-type lectin domain family 2 member L-like [Chrysemys picta bellii]|uniref:C-type lectin domain family 2 member L-like n=1 Tax=Chrysemys picta bellii TaxID=8478 RepID=UPI0032B26400
MGTVVALAVRVSQVPVSCEGQTRGAANASENDGARIVSSTECSSCLEDFWSRLKSILCEPHNGSLAVVKSRPPSCPPAASWCLDGWIRIQGKCYYFSKAEGNWTYSRSFCSSHAASLAGIESLQELDSQLPYKGKLDHWIGLRRDTVQGWKWANGTEFDSRFQIQGGGDCAYLFPAQDAAHQENGSAVNLIPLRRERSEQWIHELEGIHELNGDQL